jgi:hypothetical protein
MAVKGDKPVDDTKKPADAGNKKGGKDDNKEAELSEEDAQLKANLELMVERTADTDAGVFVLCHYTAITVGTRAACATARSR